MNKKQRLELYISRMMMCQPAASEANALQQIVTVLTGVEDEFSGLPNLTEEWGATARMYPPRADNRHYINDHVARYRSRFHNTYIAVNGAIRLELMNREILFDLPGEDGKRVIDYE